MLGCEGNQLKPTSHNTNVLHVPGSDPGAEVHVEVDALSVHYKANEREYSLSNDAAAPARLGLNAARTSTTPILTHTQGASAIHVFETQLQQQKVRVQGHLLRQADEDDRDSFVTTISQSGHRVGKYESYNETEAVLQVSGALAPQQPQQWPGNIRPALRHFAPLRHYATALQGDPSAAASQRACCMAQYDDSQQAAWVVTTMKPVNNALHPGWGTMGTFMMPANARSNFFCSASQNPANRTSACADQLQSLCYTPNSEHECAKFDGVRGGKTKGPEDLRPKRCMGFWARDVAVRTVCRAYTRAITNWERASTAMQSHCEYLEVPKAQRDTRRTDPTDPRRLSCMHWCAHFCRQDTPWHKIRKGGDQQYMCDKEAAVGTPARAGAWCEDYMMPQAAVDSDAQRAIGLTKLGSGGLTEHGGGGAGTTRFSENPIFAESAITYGACLADAAQNRRHSNACGCITPDTFGTVNLSSIGNAQCHNIQNCRLYGFVKYADKMFKCNESCSSAQVVNAGNVTATDGGNIAINQHAQCCTEDETTHKSTCESHWCVELSNGREEAITSCAHDPDPDVADDHLVLVKPGPSCKSVLSADSADSAWLDSVTNDDASARVVLGGFAVPTEPSSTSVLCLRHDGAYRCSKGVVLSPSSAADADREVRTRLVGDAESSEESAGFTVASAGSRGLAFCAVSCDKDAIHGAQQAGYGTSSDDTKQQTSTYAGRCIGFRYDMASGTCIPYGAAKNPTTTVKGTLVEGLRIGYGAKGCRMRCANVGAGNCIDALAPVTTVDSAPAARASPAARATPAAGASPAAGTSPAAGAGKVGGKDEEGIGADTIALGAAALAVVAVVVRVAL
jgi:hypothetical protein